MSSLEKSSQRPELERFAQTLRPGEKRVRLRDKDGSIGMYMGYDAQRDAPFAFRLIADGETRFACLREFILLPNASM